MKASALFGVAATNASGLTVGRLGLRPTARARSRVGPSQGVLWTPTEAVHTPGQTKPRWLPVVEAFRSYRCARCDLLVVVPERVELTRKNGRRDERTHWREERDPTPREKVLLEGDKHTLPVDFHSWRRAFSQALAEAGVNEQQAMGLTGHESEEAHRRYLRNAERLRELPLAALPPLQVSDPRDPIASVIDESSFFSARHTGFEPVAFGSGDRCTWLSSVL